MARAQQNQRAETVRTSTTSRGRRTASRSTVAVLGLSALAAVWAATMLTGAGQQVYAYMFFFTEFYAGVIALVALSLTVMMGLLATDRLVLKIPHRVLMQSAHRATGIIGVSGLVLHVMTKVATGRAAATDAVVPFLGGRGLYVGLGTVAAFLMVSVLWTGIIRARFAGVGPKWVWRSLHATAYLSWPFAMMHGLNAGRPAATWVTLSYLACLLAVMMALVVRASVSMGRRSREQGQAAALDKAMAGRPAEEGLTASLRERLGRRKGEAAARPAKESRPGRSRDAGGWAEPAAGSWSGAAPRSRDTSRFTVPVVPEAGTLSESSRRRPDVTRRVEEPVARRRVEEPAGRRRVEEPVARRRAEEPAARSRSTESAAAWRDPEEERRGRRAADLVAPRSDTGAGRHSAPPAPDWRSEPEEPWDSPRRWTAAEEPISAAPRSGGGRHSVEEDLPEEADYWRPPARYAPDETLLPADDTPTLVDLASRRARRNAGESRTARRRRASADAVDGAYWAGLRGEAK